MNDAILLINDDILVLVREENPSDNRVCEKCALNNVCFGILGSTNLKYLCENNFPTQGCFFVNAEKLTKSQQEEVKDRFIKLHSLL